MTAAIILALRVLLLLLALSCLWLSGSSVVALWRGSQSLAQAGRAVQAFFALSCVVGQVYWLEIWQRPPILMAALLCSSVGLGLAIWTYQRARGKGMDLDALIDRPDLALPLVELAQIDEVKAAAMAQEARRLIAELRGP